MLHHFAKHLGNRFRGSGAILNGALGGFVGTSTIGALPVLLLPVALGYNMPYPFAPIASGNAVVWVHVVEDGHFNRSPSTRWEWDYGPNDPWGFDKRGLDWGVARA